MKVILALNTANQETETQVLTAQDFQPTVLNGRYTHDNGEAIEETSYLVEVSTDRQLAELVAIAQEHKQESILVLDDQNNAKLLYMSDYRTLDLGVFTNCTKDEAEASEAYSFNPITNEYYICVS